MPGFIMFLMSFPSCSLDLTVQRTALVRTLSAFKTEATVTLEVEAYVLPTRLRLKKRSQDVVTSLHTLPSSHPIHYVLERAKRRSQNVESLPRFPLAEVMKTMDCEWLSVLETINYRSLAPWDLPAFEEISIDSKQDRARKIP
jgi:hypothetical protein